MRLRRFLIGTFACFGLTVAVVMFTPVVFWYATWLSGKWNVPDGDVLIVLSASTGPDGMLARDSYLRATYAALFWRQGHFRTLLICGRDAGPLIRDYLVFSGVPAASILVENDSTSTRENALFAGRVLPANSGRKMLLTSDFHMRRAAAAFRKAGVAVEPLPIPDVRKYSGNPAYRWPIAADLAQETAKILYYLWEGWI